LQCICDLIRAYHVEADSCYRVSVEIGYAENEKFLSLPNF